MPRKVRELKADLRRAGFSEQPGKGSHSGWRHPLLQDKLTLSGHDGDDARPYQERGLRAILAKLRIAQQRRQP
jgi:predicted RNA binding protein YcfA (HicA-like mRNA interferase family)